jgi:CBS domain-containing protein
MKLEHLSIATGVMRKGMTLRDFFEECVRCNVPGLPYVDDQDRIVGRISIRDVYKHMAIPDSVIRVAHLLEMKVSETLDLPVETFLLENIPSVSPRSSIVKALAIMEMYNTSYIFLIENGEYKGLVTRMVIAHRMLLCIQEQESKHESTPSGERRHDSCFPHDE